MSIFAAILPLVSTVIERIFPNQADADKAKLELLKLQLEGESKLLEAAKTVDTAQAAINNEEAKSDSFFKSGARPFILWVCATAYAWQFVLLPIVTYVLLVLGITVPEMPVLNSEELTTLLFGLLGLGFYRTLDKYTGKKG